MAVDDNYIHGNLSDGVLKELKQSHVFKTEKRRGLTKPERDLLLDFLRHTFTTRMCEAGVNIKVMQDCGYFHHREHLCRCDQGTEEG